MIIGNGLLGSAFSQIFSDDKEVVIFASGVSNSKETRPEAFQREYDLLKDALCTDSFVAYFSTCSVYDTELLKTHYVQHKIKMEQLVLDSGKHRAVFRLPQVVGHCVNPHTLTNYLYGQIMCGQKFQVWLNASRNLIDVNDVMKIVTSYIKDMPSNKSVLNIACPFSIRIPDLVNIFETVLNRKAVYEIVLAGDGYHIDTEQMTIHAKRAGVTFDETYVTNLIKTYYS